MDTFTIGGYHMIFLLLMAFIFSTSLTLFLYINYKAGSKYNYLIGIILSACITAIFFTGSLTYHNSAEYIPVTPEDVQATDVSIIRNHEFDYLDGPMTHIKGTIGGEPISMEIPDISIIDYTMGTISLVVIGKYPGKKTFVKDELTYFLYVE